MKDRDFKRGMDRVLSTAGEFPYYIVTILIYAAALAVVSLIIVRMHLLDTLLHFFLIPCILSDFFFKRRVYLSMQLLLIGAAVWVTSHISSDFQTSMTSITAIGISCILITETIHVLVNDRKEAEDALRESRERYKILLESIPDSVYVLDSEWRHVMVNEAATQLVQLSRETLIGGKLTELFPGVEETTFFKVFQRAMRTREPDTVVNEYTFEGGRRGWYEVRVYPVPEGILCISRDITARKQAEEALLESEEKLRNIVEHSTNLFYAHTPDYELTYLSPQSQEFLQCESEEAMVRWTEFITDHPTNEEGLALTEKAIATGKRQPPYQLELVGKKGHKIWVEVREVPVVRGGKTVAIVGSLTDITERKQTEEALRRSEEMLRLIFEHAFDGISIYEELPNSQRRLVNCNEKYAEMAGISKQELLEMSNTGAFQKRLELPRSTGENLCLRQNLTAYRGVFSWLRPDGRENVIEYTATPIEVEGKPLTVGIDRDITARVQAEEALRREIAIRQRTEEDLRDRERFLVLLNNITRAALETSDLPTMLQIIADQLGDLFNADGCYLTLWDEERETVIPIAAYGTRGDEYWAVPMQAAGAAKPDVVTITTSVLRAGRPIAFEDVNNSQHITEVFPAHSLLGLPLIAGDKKLGTALIAFHAPHTFTLKEITRSTQIAGEVALAVAKAKLVAELQRYTNELEIRVTERTAELHAQYAHLEAILRSVGDAIFMTGPDRRIRYVNPAFTKLTGYTADEVLDRDVCTLKVTANCAPLLKAALTQGTQWQGDIILQRKDGRKYDATLKMAPIQNATAQTTRTPAGYVFSHQDISRRKDLERARNQFMTNISHQFRTPITTLKLNVYLMSHDKVTERQRSRLVMMETHINWLMQLIEDTLILTKLDSGTIIETWQPMAIPSIVGDVIMHHQDQAHAAGMTLLAAPFPSDLPEVKGDAVLLTQALNELVENALIFTVGSEQSAPGERVTLHVAPVTDTGATWVTIAVQDTGPGIPLEEQERVFERFFRGYLAKTGNIQGTGLGLSIVHKIMQAQGGRVTVESTVGEGSTFTLWLRGSPHAHS